MVMVGCDSDDDGGDSDFDVEGCCRNGIFLEIEFYHS